MVQRARRWSKKNGREVARRWPDGPNFGPKSGPKVAKKLARNGQKCDQKLSTAGQNMNARKQPLITSKVCGRAFCVVRVIQKVRNSRPGIFFSFKIRRGFFYNFPVLLFLYIFIYSFPITHMLICINSSADSRDSQHTLLSPRECSPVSRASRRWRDAI